MKRAIVAIAIGAAILATPVVAADSAAKKPPVATKSATGTKSLDPSKGRFHKLHTQKLKMECNSCHTGGQTDVLFLRKDDAPTPGMPGQVNREVCLSCHKAPAKPAWYGAAR